MAVIPIPPDELAAVRRLCIRHKVGKLSLFGSAVRGGFGGTARDLDFLAEFQPMTPAQHADHYFGLAEDLERLFGLPADLVEPGPIRNPYSRSAVEESQVVLYDAA